MTLPSPNLREGPRRPCPDTDPDCHENGMDTGPDLDINWLRVVVIGEKVVFWILMFVLFVLVVVK